MKLIQHLPWLPLLSSLPAAAHTGAGLSVTEHLSTHLLEAGGLAIIILGLFITSRYLRKTTD